MAAIHLLKKINNVITAQVGLRLGIQFKSANPQNTLFYTSNLRIKFRSFQGIISAQRPRKPRERPFASPQTVRPAADPLPVCKCGQPTRKMYTRLDYRERSHRVTSWSHISSQLGRAALLPKLFSPPWLLFSTVYTAVLLLHVLYQPNWGGHWLDGSDTCCIFVNWEGSFMWKFHSWNGHHVYVTLYSRKKLKANNWFTREEGSKQKMSLK